MSTAVDRPPRMSPVGGAGAWPSCRIWATIARSGSRSGMRVTRANSSLGQKETPLGPMGLGGVFRALRSAPSANGFAVYAQALPAAVQVTQLGAEQIVFAGAGLA